MTATAMLGDPRRQAFDQKVLAWMTEGSWEKDDARFDTLACELFEVQFAYCTGYGRFCEALGKTPSSISNYRDIPAVPTSAFKEARLHSFDADATTKVFRTSGTTTGSTGQARGSLYLDTLSLYEASLLPMIRRFVFPERDGDASEKPMTIRILANPPEMASDSSLSHMFGIALRELGDGDSGYENRDGVLNAAPLITRLLQFSERAEEKGPVALCGTSFAFVHLLDALDASPHRDKKLQLPRGSRVMETGGFKGRSREVPRDELYDAIENRLGVARSHIVNQYGMAELGSQFYDSQLYESVRGGTLGPRRKLGPPWARVRLIDPETGEDVASGQTGMIVVHDLANTGSVAALQTEDLGRRTGIEDDGFEVLGRASGAEARGCSIAADATWLKSMR